MRPILGPLPKERADEADDLDGAPPAARSRNPVTRGPPGVVEREGVLGTSEWGVSQWASE